MIQDDYATVRCIICDRPALCHTLTEARSHTELMEMQISARVAALPKWARLFYVVGYYVVVAWDWITGRFPKRRAS